MICSFGAPLLFEQPPFLPLLLRAATHLSRPAADCPLLSINLAAIQRTKIDVNQISSGLKWFTMFMITVTISDDSATKASLGQIGATCCQASIRQTCHDFWCRMLIPPWRPILTVCKASQKTRAFKSSHRTRCTRCTLDTVQNTRTKSAMVNSPKVCNGQLSQSEVLQRMLRMTNRCAVFLDLKCCVCCMAERAERANTTTSGRKAFIGTHCRIIRLRFGLDS